MVARVSSHLRRPMKELKSLSVRKAFKFLWVFILRTAVGVAWCSQGKNLSRLRKSKNNQRQSLVLCDFSFEIALALLIFIANLDVSCELYIIWI